jgi:S-formylglutathione hydrolase
MKLSVYVPPQAENEKVPVLYWLSGLTCTEENFMTKAGAQKYAAEKGLMIVAPDTSPRGEGVPTGDTWELGLGAGFYVNATTDKWKKHYRMDSYVSEELPKLIEDHLPAEPGRKSISGHSMGGHGALTQWFRNPGMYQSVSAFSPIVAPTLAPWGKKAFSEYLGADEAAWREYDATHLVKNAKDRKTILIDQGTHDKFLSEQLKPEVFRKVCEAVDYPLNLRMQEGYDHSYYFIATFIQDHIYFHAKALD